MAEAVKDFKELRVYRSAFETAMDLFGRSRTWPQDERYSLTDQIRRSSRSICANIAEAWRKRRYPAHFSSKLSDADSEAGETLVWVAFAHRCGYLSKAECDRLTDVYDHICARLVTMIQQADSWCGV